MDPLDRTRQLIVANWKMNGLMAASAAFDAMVAGAAERRAAGALTARVVVCPPATLVIGFAARAADGPIAVGGQTCHAAASGAHTGEISAEMLADAGADCVILGHSERRAAGETDAQIQAKTAAAWRAGLTAIVCVGETAAERDAGSAEDVVLGQLGASLPDAVAPGRLAIAYEPVWAIGTGRTPSVADIEAMHGAVEGALGRRYGAPGDAAPVLYGGSVSPANAAEILAAPGVGGALVGGASLKAEGFLAIVDAAV